MIRQCNPCPCTSLESGVKILAFFNIVECILSVITVSFFLYALDNPGAIDPYLEKLAEEEGQLMLIIDLVFSIPAIFFSIGLFYWGVIKKNTGICWAWIGFTAISLIRHVAIVILGVSGIVDGESDGISIAASVVTIIVECYMIWVVYSFIMQLRQQQGHPELLGGALGLYVGEGGGIPQGSLYRAIDTGNYYAAEQPDYTTPMDQPQPTVIPATV